MSLHYLLDGYNIIKKVPVLSDKKLNEARDGLIRLIEACRPEGSLNNRVTVVFDGRSDVIGPDCSSSVEVVFTSDESADEKIKRFVAQSPRKKQIVVVSDDREIRYAVRASGARIMSVKEFYGKLDLEPSGSKPEEHVKKIPKTLEDKITSEFEKLWVKKDR